MMTLGECWEEATYATESSGVATWSDQSWGCEMLKSPSSVSDVDRNRNRSRQEFGLIGSHVLWFSLNLWFTCLVVFLALAAAPSLIPAFFFTPPSVCLSHTNILYNNTHRWVFSSQADVGSYEIPITILAHSSSGVVQLHNSVYTHWEEECSCIISSRGRHPPGWNMQTAPLSRRQSLLDISHSAVHTPGAQTLHKTHKITVWDTVILNLVSSGSQQGRDFTVCTSRQKWLSQGLMDYFFL